MEHLGLGAITVDGIKTAIGEIVAIFHLEDHAFIADPVEAVHLVFILRSAAEELAVGKPNGEKVVFALARRDRSQPFAVRGKTHPTELRILEKCLNGQLLSLAKRGKPGQGQAKRGRSHDGDGDCFHFAQDDLPRIVIPNREQTVPSYFLARRTKKSRGQSTTGFDCELVVRLRSGQSLGRTERYPKDCGLRCRTSTLPARRLTKADPRR